MGSPLHKVYPYLLKGVTINRVNQVWTADITYIPMARGFLYLVAIMDWHSRYVLTWWLSNTLEVDFCVEALEDALGKAKPEIFNTDQGSQFTSEAFTGILLEQDLGVAAMVGLQFEGLPLPVGDEAVIAVGGEEGQLGTGRGLHPPDDEPYRRGVGHSQPPWTALEARCGY